MKKKILGTVALACVLSCAPQTVSAQVALPPIPPQVRNLMDSILGIMGDDAKFCGKGSFFGGKINIRSSEGILCKFSPFAAVAEKRCLNNPNPAIANDFRNGSDGTGSKCFKNLTEAYKGRTVAQALMEDIPRLPKVVADGYCARASSVSPEIKAACDARRAAPVVR